MTGACDAFALFFFHRLAFLIEGHYIFLLVGRLYYFLFRWALFRCFRRFTHDVKFKKEN